jgi:hypothetical protein
VAGELGIGKEDLARRFAASLLRSGASMDEAQRLSVNLAEDFHRDFAGKRLVIRIGRDFQRNLDPAERRRIFMRYWLDREVDHVLCTEEKICHATLRRIKREGKSKGWAEKR